MNKADIIKKTAQKLKIKHSIVEQVVDGFFDEVADALAGGEKVNIAGFGCFNVRERQARTSINPRTGKEMNITEAKLPTFKAGKTLKGRINAQ